MSPLKQEYRQFLSNNFKGLTLKQPLFYSWNLGLRFNLQLGDTSTNEYFLEVVRRASTIFESAFDQSDELFFIVKDFKYKRRKIRYPNYAFQQIKNLRKATISYSKERGIYDPGCTYNVAIIKLTASRINHKKILTAIGHADFPPRLPRLDNRGIFTSKEIYFININKKLIFHMYDDRGLDIIAADRQTLRSIYEIHKDLLLDCDIAKIDKQFE
jgi:hypothetical protein